MEKLERQYKALAYRKRLAIIKFLKRTRQASVGEIAAEIKLTLKATSKHLNILSSIDALEKTKQGLVVYYRLADKQQPVLKQLINLV